MPSTCHVVDMYAMSPLEALPRASGSPFALLSMLTHNLKRQRLKSQGASKDAGKKVRG